jgi:hypothetical protein
MFRVCTVKIEASGSSKMFVPIYKATRASRPRGQFWLFYGVMIVYFSLYTFEQRTERIWKEALVD